MSNAQRTATPTILGKIEEFVTTYVAFPSPDHAPVLAAWVLHTHAFDAAYATPYIYVHSAEMQSGKTRVIDVMESIARNSSRMIQTSTAGLYRQIEAERPTLMIDEVDAIYSGNKNEEMRSVLNGGYKPSGFVTKVNKDGEGIDRFSTFCPKLLAGIDNGSMPGTVLDRTIPIQLKRKRKDETVERFLSRDVDPIAEALREEIEAWVEENLDALREARPVIEDELSDRQWEISEPLIAIAERISKKEGNRVRKALLNLFAGVNPAKSDGAKVLEAARGLFNDNPDRKRFLTAELIDRLGNDMHPKTLGGILKPYGIAAKNVRVGSTQGKGFEVSMFEDAFQRYL